MRTPRRRKVIRKGSHAYPKSFRLFGAAAWDLGCPFCSWISFLCVVLFCRFVSEGDEAYLKVECLFVPRSLPVFLFVCFVCACFSFL